MAQHTIFGSDASGTVSDDSPSQPRDGDTHSSHAVLVHETRKTIKRMRALALLLRYELGEDELKRRREALRVTAGHLAGARDAEVRLATFERLMKRHPRALAVEGIELLGRQLELERDEARRPVDDRALLDDIEGLRGELAGLRIAEHDLGSLTPGLKRLYSEGRSRYRRTLRLNADDVVAIHDWRKRVKSLYYALDALGGSVRARAATRRAERLGDLLGEEHDLWLLESYVQERPEAVGTDSSARETLLKLASRRRRSLHKRAVSQGARLYERRSAEFARRMQKMLGPADEL